MKIHQILFCIAVALLNATSGFAQNEQTSVSDQIKTERDSQLNKLNDQLKRNEEDIKTLTDKLTQSEKSYTQEKDKVEDLRKLQLALDNRIKILEETPKTDINLNGQLAFTELLSIQRDLSPAKLFLSSQDFFKSLGNVGNLQEYDDFNLWRTEYDKWYVKQDRNDQMLQIVDNSVKLITDLTNKVPLYGSISQTVSSGLSSLVSSLGNKHKELKSKTPNMLKLLNAASQFESQKVLIDHEWELINKELKQLHIEDSLLLHDQLTFYGIDEKLYKQYMNATLDDDRDDVKNTCRKIISDKLIALEKDDASRGQWLSQVKTYMYKVQSLRLRFGQLTNRMLSNITRYETLIHLFSDRSKFPSEFAVKINGLSGILGSVKENFVGTFKPEKYIEDSAVMYLKRQ